MSKPGAMELEAGKGVGSPAGRGSPNRSSTRAGARSTMAARRSPSAAMTGGATMVMLPSPVGAEKAAITSVTAMVQPGGRGPSGADAAGAGAAGSAGAGGGSAALMDAGYAAHIRAANRLARRLNLPFIYV